MYLDIYLGASFIVLIFLIVTVARTIDPRSLQQTSRAERIKNLREKFRWWWLLIFVIPIVNFVITSLYY